MNRRFFLTLCAALLAAPCSMASAADKVGAERADKSPPNPAPEPKPEEKPIVVEKKPSEPARVASRPILAAPAQLSMWAWVRTLLN